MSNRAESGYVTFRDDVGAVVAAGTIEWFENNDTNTQANIWSDAALSVPQSNPYTLDAVGRIVGDIFFNDTLTYVLKDSTGAVVRQVNDVLGNIAVVTASATAEGISELATDAETVTGSATNRVTTPANITAKMSAPGPIGDTTPSTGAFSTLSASGDVTLSGGNLVIGTSGKGIDFSATADAAGMTAELFADYEEGTFTPTLTFAAGSGTITYTTQNGSYTKIGRQVFIETTINTSSIASRTGNITYNGLPFTIGATFVSGLIAVTGTGLASSAGHNVTAWMVAGFTKAAMVHWDSNFGTSNMTDVDWSDNGGVDMIGHYHV